MTRTIVLEAEKLKTRSLMMEYMDEVLDLPSGSVLNQDTLHDYLIEDTTETVMILTQPNAQSVTSSKYGYRTLMTIADAAEINPHLHLRFEK
ncbi:MAG: hypothetical protein K6G61_02675 [Solobacterium sp.]|nr:hypothetical protein [Solobacterium sp.]